MSPDLSRRLGAAVGTRVVSPDERSAIIAALPGVEEWPDLPAEIRQLVEEIESRPEGLGDR